MKNVFKYTVTIMIVIFLSSCKTTERNKLNLTNLNKNWNTKVEEKQVGFGRAQTLVAHTIGGYVAALYYFVGNGGVWGGPMVISKQQIESWNVFKNKTYTIQKSQNYKNNIGDIEFAKIVMRNRDCYYLMSAISTSPMDDLNRPNKVLIGYYCGPLNKKIDDDEIYSFLDNVSLLAPRDSDSELKRSSKKDDYVGKGSGPITDSLISSLGSQNKSKRKADKLGSRPIAISWDNKFGLMAGSIEFTDKKNKGRLYFDLPNGSGQCLGRFFRTDNQGVWSASCPKGVSASGKFLVTNKGGSGLGTDNEGNNIRFSLGALTP